MRFFEGIISYIIIQVDVYDVLVTLQVEVKGHHMSVLVALPPCNVHI